jgi:hypothetical protein
MVFAIHAKEGIKQLLTKTLTQLKTTQLSKRKQWPNVRMATKKGNKEGIEDRIANQRCPEVPYVQRHANITDKRHMALAKSMRGRHGRPSSLH